MKTKRILLAGVAVAAWTLGGITPALAQGPPSGGGASCPSKGGGSGGGGGRPPGGEGIYGGLPDLGKAADRLQAWKLATLEGAGSFSKYQQEERKVYQELVAKIRQANLEDRLGGKDARTFLMKGLKLNEPGAGRSGNFEARLKALDSEVDQALTDSVNAATLTPRLNELQWLISESLIYGAKTKQLSAAKVSSINRKLLAHEEKEVKAKKDGRLTDLERKRLDEGAMKIWKVMVKELKGRND